MVEPVYPTFQRPQFDLAPVLAKANVLSLQSQQIDQNKKMNPLEVARAQQQVDLEGKLNPLEIQRAQQGVEASGRANRIGAATEDSTIAADNAARDAQVVTSLSGMNRTKAYDTWARTQAIAGVTSYVVQHPDAVDAAKKSLIDQGVFATPDEADAWAQTINDPTAVEHILGVAKTTDDFMVQQRQAGAYGKSSNLEAYKTDRQYTLAANAETNKFMVRNPEATPEQIDHFYKTQLARLKGQPAPPAPPTPPEGPGWWERNAPEWLGGAAPAEAAAGSVQADQAAHEEQLAPPAEKPAPAKTRSIKPAGGKEAAPAPVDAPAAFDGDAADTAAVKAWYNALPMNSAVVIPGSPPGTAPVIKHSNFAE